MADAAEEAADEFDRRIEGIARRHLGFDRSAVGLGAVLRTKAQVRRLVIGEKGLVVVGNAVNHGMADALGQQAAADQTHEVVEASLPPADDADGEDSDDGADEDDTDSAVSQLDEELLNDLVL